jgi:hypothetical protein
MPWSQLPDAPAWLEKMLSGLWAFLLSAAIGRLMWHTKLVQMGHRKFFSVHLLWEIPTAIGMAMIGRGAGEYFQLTENSSVALVAVLSYLGPRGIEAMFRTWLNRGAAHLQGTPEPKGDAK